MEDAFGLHLCRGSNSGHCYTSRLLQSSLWYVNVALTHPNVVRAVLWEVLSASCPLLDIAWPPLALCCTVRLIYVIRIVHKLEKATKTSPSLIRSIQMILVAVPILQFMNAYKGACCWRKLLPCRTVLAKTSSWYDAHNINCFELENASAEQLRKKRRI